LPCRAGPNRRRNPGRLFRQSNRSSAASWSFTDGGCVATLLSPCRAQLTLRVDVIRRLLSGLPEHANREGTRTVRGTIRNDRKFLIVRLRISGLSLVRGPATTPKFGNGDLATRSSTLPPQALRKVCCPTICAIRESRKGLPLQIIRQSPSTGAFKCHERCKQAC